MWREVVGVGMNNEEELWVVKYFVSGFGCWLHGWVHIVKLQ